MDGVSSVFVALSVAALLLTTAGAHGCLFELSPPRVVVKYGDRVSMNCTTQESQENFDKIGWEAKLGSVSAADTNNITWTIESVTEWEEAPMCYYNLKDGGQCGKDADFVIYKFPDSIDIISTTGSSGVMTLLENHNLTCTINNVAPVKYLVVRWFKNDKSLHNETFNNNIKRPSNIASQIALTPLREDREAVYRCEAHLDLGPEGPHLNTTKKYTVKVHYGPEISCPDSPLMVKKGTALKDVCNVTGNPIKSIQWFKDGRDTNQSIPLTENEYGNYTLKVDGYTLIEKNFTIRVLYGPKLTCNDSQTVRENDPFKLNCIVEGHPKPNLTLYKEDEEVQLPDKLTRKDGGFYKIHASINQQTVESHINISVIYPPSQISELEDSVVKVGSDVWLKCSSKGNPQLEYLWEYYNSSNVAEKHEDGVTYLSITNATAENMGVYTCRAKNEIGNVSKTVKLSVEGVCPIEITPNRMVVQYQSQGQQARCKSITQDKDLDLSWIYRHGQSSGTSWSVNTYNRFDLKPSCEAKSKHDNSTCRKPLDIIVYKLPRRVSIDLLNSSSSVVEGTEFQLQCKITSVAPARSVTVRWYEDNDILEPRSEGTVTVTECWALNGSGCDIRLVSTPLSLLFTISLNATRAQSGKQFWCVPEFNLGPEGPQSLTQFSSTPVNLTVYYKPTINNTKLPSTIPVFNGYPEDLVCEADGNPPPHIMWTRGADGKLCGSNSTLTVSEAGVYYCNATNAAGSVSHRIQVILKEDYLPIIAGLVAVVVIAISVFFAFIYSIYYKNTKIGRYNLKKVKLNNTHNGNVAHNGWESQVPMTRLS